MAVRAHDLQKPFQGDAIVYKFPNARPRGASAKDRGALILVTLAAVLGLIAGGWQGTSAAASAGVSGARAPRTVVVQPGDTLWSIAEDNAPAGVDVRSYMEQILALNGRVAAVAPGWRLKLPR